MSLLSLVLVAAFTPAHAQPYGLTQRPAVGPFLNGALPPAEAVPTGWQVVDAFPNLRFDDATVFTPEPGTNRLYVCERQGKIYHFPNIPNTTNKVLFLDLTAKTQGYNDCGVLGFAFHPQYRVPGSTNRGYVYVYYNYSPSPVGIGPGGVAPDNTPMFDRLSRFTVPDGSSVADPNSEYVLINHYDRHLWHNGGGLFFGSDGFLYLSIGDEGDTADSFNSTQKINAGLFSGVLRIDVDRDPARSHPIRRQPTPGGTPPGNWPKTYTTNYFIPNDNPWLATNGSLMEEFYAIGVRSPHRMTYDALTDRIWLGDVGQAAWEEVSVIEKGGNYQWAYREGDNPGPKAKPSPLIGTDKPPIYDYPHDANGNTCVIGGYVYRGVNFPSLYGKYIFGDNSLGRIWSMDYSVTPPVVSELAVIPNGTYSLTTFGLDQSKEMFMCVIGSQKPIYKLAATGVQAPPPPALLSQTGAFTNLTTLAPGSSLIPYDINSPLWSDNAAKKRWLAIPTNTTIAYSSNGNWSFPTGTVLVKHFDLPINDTNPAVTKRLETRFLTLGTNGAWFGYTYKWRADNSDADLLPTGLSETNLITTATGVRTQIWSYPSRTDCMTCHNANSGAVLGPRTCQLNGNTYYPATGQTDNQLRALNHIGLFNTNLNEAAIPGLPAVVPVTDTNASLELRVRSYLQANCAHCHQPNGARGFFDARFSTPLDQQNLIGGIVENPLGISGARVIYPGSTNQSILFVRDAALGNNQMPPLAKNMVDTNYINVLAAWINTLPPLPLPPASALGIMGNTNTSTTSDNIWDTGPYINSAQFVAASNLPIAFIHANVFGVTGRYQCAIYSDNAGLPDALLATSQAITNPATGWRKFPLTSPLTLAANNVYWLSIWSDSSAARVFFNSTGGTLRWGQYNFGNWPNPITTSGGNSYNYNIYASGGAAPVFNATPTNRTIPELTLLTVTNAATDADAPFQTVGYALANPPAGATISSNGVITWIPSEAQGPSTNQIVTVANDGLVAITNTFQVIVTEVNAAPIAHSQSLTNAEDTLLPIVLTGMDPDGPTMNFLVVTNPIHGSLTGAAPNLSYLPATNYFGPDSLAFRIHDGSLTSAVAIVSLTITNVNDAPIAAPDAAARWMSQGLTVLPGVLLTNDTDADGDLLTLLTVTNATPLGTTLSFTTNGITYWPPYGNTNSGTFDYIITDGQGAYATGLVSITVMPEPPITELLGIQTGSGTYTLSFTGLPGFTYTVQYSDSLEPVSWQNLGTAIADGSGNVQYMDDTPGSGPTRFYRAVRGIVP